MPIPSTPAMAHHLELLKTPNTSPAGSPLHTPIDDSGCSFCIDVSSNSQRREFCSCELSGRPTGAQGSLRPSPSTVTLHVDPLAPTDGYLVTAQHSPVSGQGSPTLWDHVRASQNTQSQLMDFAVQEHRKIVAANRALWHTAQTHKLAFDEKVKELGDQKLRCEQSYGNLRAKYDERTHEAQYWKRVVDLLVPQVECHSCTCGMEDGGPISIMRCKHMYCEECLTHSGGGCPVCEEGGHEVLWSTESAMD